VLALVGVALALRLLAVLASDRVVVDVLRYQKVADHVLDVSWNPYRAPRLYPYPPLWVWAEAGSGWLARASGLSFAVLVKLPVLLAELGLIATLVPMGRAAGLGNRPAWAYALHPVSLLIGGFHGQFESLALLGVLLALFWLERGRADRSALALAFGIGAKSFPVLVLPFLLARLEAPRARVRYLLLALGPVALSLVPYAAHDAAALGRELFGYAGVADFGWIALVRGLRWLATGVLPRSEARYWAPLVTAGKLVFLVCWAVLALASLRGRVRLDTTRATLAVFAGFLALYGAISAQYLLWLAPFGLLVSLRSSAVYAGAATLGLLGFYGFLAPGVLWAASGDRGPQPFGLVWLGGVALVQALTLAWLATLLVAKAPPGGTTTGHGGSRRR
jgi:hypothetical protein